MGFTVLNESEEYANKIKELSEEREEFDRATVRYHTPECCRPSKR
jgi:hypothetical protein